MRVVLYAEGPNETGSIEMPPLSGRDPAIAEDDLGPAHILTRRCIARVTSHAEPSIQFHAPLRIRARASRGSQLLDPKVLTKLLTWTHPARSPDLAVVLVDADGIGTERRKKLRELVSRREISVPPTVVAIAVEEFESWLLADQRTIHQELGHRFDTLNLNRWKPGEAKNWLVQRLATVGSHRSEQVRRALSQKCDLELLSNANSSFAKFLGELRMTCKSIA